MAIPTRREIMEFSPINSGGREKLPAYRRQDFVGIKKAMGSGLIVAITGLRRVGKSTLMKQLFEGREAFYFSFDEKKYANGEALKAVIGAFLDSAETPLIGLDEIFRVDDWAGIVKKYHDQKRARFVVSGSSALMVRGGVESLAGRMAEHYMPPLRFGEYLELAGRPSAAVPADIFRAKRPGVEEAEGFLAKGSFPETVNMGEPAAQQYIRSATVEKIVFDDIPSIFRIEHPSKLYDLLRLCATNSGRLFTEVNLAEALQMSRHAVSDYLLYLQKAYLSDVIYPAGSLQKALKKQKKAFVKAAPIYNALAENPNMGQAAETAVYDKLSSRHVEFYRDAQQREVDFICGGPIEVKYQSAITSADIGNLLYYMKSKNRATGTVVTKDLFDEKKIGGKRILYMPLDVFLLSKQA